MKNNTYVKTKWPKNVVVSSTTVSTKQNLPFDLAFDTFN